MPYDNIPYLYLSGMPDLYHVRMFSPKDPYDAEILEAPHNALKLNLGVLSQIGSAIREKYESLVKDYHITMKDQATGNLITIAKTLVPHVKYALNAKYLTDGHQLFSAFSSVSHNHDDMYYKIGDVVTSTMLLQGRGAESFAVVAHNHDKYFLKRTSPAVDTSNLGGYASTAFAVVGHNHDHVYLKRGLSFSEYSLLKHHPEYIGKYREDLHLSGKFPLPSNPSSYPQMGWDEIAKDADALVNVPGAETSVPSAQRLKGGYTRVTSHDLSSANHNHDESYYRRGEPVYRAWSILGSLSPDGTPSSTPKFYHAEDFALRYHTHPDYVQPMRLEAEFYRKEDQVFSSEKIQNRKLYIFIMDFSEDALSTLTMTSGMTWNPLADLLKLFSNASNLNDPFSMTVQQPLVNIEGMSWSYITSDLTPLGGVTSSSDPSQGWLNQIFGSVRNLASPSWFLQNDYMSGTMQSSFNFIQLNPISYNTTDNETPGALWASGVHIFMKPILGMVWASSGDMPQQVTTQ